MRRCALFDTATTQMRGLWRLALVVGAVAARAVPTQLGRGTAEGASGRERPPRRGGRRHRVAVAMGHRLLAHLALLLALPFLLVLLLTLPFLFILLLALPFLGSLNGCHLQSVAMGLRRAHRRCYRRRRR